MSVPAAVVIPVSPGHEENLQRTLAALNCQTGGLAAVVVVAHRFGLAGRLDLHNRAQRFCGYPWIIAEAHDQQAPRTVGAQIVERDLRQYGVERVAFLDSDIEVGRDWLAELEEYMDESGADVVAGPYEFMREGETREGSSTRNDTRWPLFSLARTRYQTDDFTFPTWTGDVTRGLALYGGNLLWNLDKFLNLGGFLPLVRGEDGELGIRAARHNITMGFAWRARGWHQWHPVDLPRIQEQNRRDIPKIWDIHGDYLDAHGISMVPEDGMRLNIRDTEGWDGNTALLWQREMERPEGIEWVRP